MSDSGDDDKSGYSDAFKRAAVKFGVARYLYRDGVPAFVQERTGNPEHPHEPPSKAAAMPPANDHAHANGKTTGLWGGSKPAQTRPPAASSNGVAGDKAPRDGRAFFRWVKDQEQRHEFGLLKYMNGWAKLQDFPGRMVDWDAGQIALAHTEAVRRLGSLESQEVGA
jgi:hypothetical protein